MKKIKEVSQTAFKILLWTEEETSTLRMISRNLFIYGNSTLGLKYAVLKVSSGYQYCINSNDSSNF